MAPRIVRAAATRQAPACGVVRRAHAEAEATRVASATTTARALTVANPRRSFASLAEDADPRTARAAASAISARWDRSKTHVAKAASNAATAGARTLQKPALPVRVWRRRAALRIARGAVARTAPATRLESRMTRAGRAAVCVRVARSQEPRATCSLSLDDAALARRPVRHPTGAARQAMVCRAFQPAKTCAPGRRLPRFRLRVQRIQAARPARRSLGFYLRHAGSASRRSVCRSASFRASTRAPRPSSVRRAGSPWGAVSTARPTAARNVMRAR